MFFDEFGTFGGKGSYVPGKTYVPPGRRKGGAGKRAKRPYKVPNYRKSPGAPYKPRAGRFGSAGNFARPAAAAAFTPGGAFRKAASFAASLAWEYFSQEGSPFEGWGYGSTHSLTNDFPYDVQDGIDGWTVVCSGPPPGGEPSRKVGIVPGVPAISSLTCTVSGVNAANRAPGSDLPGLLTRLDLVSSSGGSPWPNRNGRPYFKAVNTSPGGSDLPLPYRKGAHVQPVADPFPEVQEMTKTATASAGGRLRVPYGVDAMSVTFPSKGPPVRNPNDEHLLVPPKPNEREEKFIDNTGRPIREIYGLISEVGDAADCLKKAIRKPKRDPHVRRKSDDRSRYPKGLRGDMAYIADNAGNIDMAAAVSCMLLSHASDAAIGVTAGGAARNFNQNPYNPRRRGGPGFGSGGFGRMR